METAEATVDPVLVRRLEEATLTTWPSLRQVFRDGWLMRFANGQTGRANSVTVLSAGSRPIDEKIAEVEVAYENAGLPPRFRITPLSEPGLDVRLADRGYAIDDPAVVMTAPLSPRLEVDPAVRLADAADRGWIQTFCATTGMDETRRRAMEGIFERLVPPFVFASMGDDGALASGPFGALSLEAAAPESVAPDTVALGVIDNDLICVLDVATRPEVRGRGLARRVVGSILAWAGGQGATSAMLQVGADNTPAVGLYRRLGFAEVYRYHYRVLNG